MFMLKRITMSYLKDLSFSNFKRDLNKLGEGEFVTVWSLIQKDGNSTAFYSALIPKKLVPTCLVKDDWDLQYGQGRPGTSTTKKKREVNTYYRNTDNGIIPLVICRLSPTKDTTYEILEEFRHYFDLVLSAQGYAILDENGDQEEVVVITKDEIKIKLRFINEFLCIKKMSLALFFELRVVVDKDLLNLGLEAKNQITKTEICIYSHVIIQDNHLNGEVQTISILRGKKVINAIKIKKEKKEIIKFIVGIDKHGNHIKKCPFSIKEEDYKIPVYFKTMLLQKYFTENDKFEVKDGVLSCKGLWYTYIDNNHSKYVIAFLGDLTLLPQSELHHFKAHNIWSTEKISEVNFRRSFKAEFIAPEAKDLLFKDQYQLLNKLWKDKFGWQIFKALHKDDQFCVDTLRIPLHDSHTEFDLNFGNLIKLFVDSLNEEKLAENLLIKPDNVLEQNFIAKGIDKLEAFLQNKGYEDTMTVKLLRDLQRLRSAGVSAHRKGTKYEEEMVKFQIEKKNLGKIFNNILNQSCNALEELKAIVVKINPQNPPINTEVVLKRKK